MNFGNIFAEGLKKTHFPKNSRPPPPTHKQKNINNLHFLAKMCLLKKLCLHFVVFVFLREGKHFSKTKIPSRSPPKKSNENAMSLDKRSWEVSSSGELTLGGKVGLKIYSCGCKCYIHEDMTYIYCICNVRNTYIHICVNIYVYIQQPFIV